MSLDGATLQAIADKFGVSKQWMDEADSLSLFLIFRRVFSDKVEVLFIMDIGNRGDIYK